MGSAMAASSRGQVSGRGDEVAATKRLVVSFTLPSNCERWHWPIEGEDSIDAFVEILDRANIPWTVRDA